MDPNRNYLLHIESATDVCSVALSKGSQLIAIQESTRERHHASVITLFIEAVMKEAGISLSALDGVVLSEGPGSYTSLRVGMSAAKGICYGLDIPLIAVSTLYSLALAASRKMGGFDYICAMIDARRMEVYASLYDAEMNNLIQNSPLILDENSFDAYLEEGKSILLCGNGAAKAIEVNYGENVVDSNVICSARHLVEPGYSLFTRNSYSDLAYFSPNYVKSPNITQAKKRLL